MKQIQLTRGEFALVDDEDFEWLNQWKWSCQICKGRKYAYRGIRNRRLGTQERIFMHRQILNAPKGTEVDHRKGLGLDNRRQNLRMASHSQNLANSKLGSSNTSGFKGVSFSKDRGKWFASIGINGRTKALGRFETAQAAAVAYNNAALDHFGEFANLNPI